MEKIRAAPRPQGLATILAIGTANPPHCVYQADFPDYYFKVTGSQHMTHLKDKLKRICEKSMIRKRHLLLTEDILSKHPSIGNHDAPSLDPRQDILVTEVPNLGKEAALKALEDWGRPKSSITHLIFSSVSGVDMPGADCQLMKLLELEATIKRVMLYHHGCHSGGTILRMAKDIVENNAGSRVLVVYSEISLGTFRGPSESNLTCLVGQAVTGDGAVALVIGADPDTKLERPIFQIVLETQRTIPDTMDKIQGHLRERGLTMHLSRDVAELISGNLGNCLEEAFGPFGVGDWNSLFWSVHLGGAGILKKIEAKLGLKEEKLGAAWHVMGEYGNMGGASVFFILDEIRRRSVEGRKKTTGEGLEWGVLVGYGAGLTIDLVVLRGVPVEVSL